MNNKRGSAIATAVVIAMVVLILLGTCFTIAGSYHNRSLENHQDRQAFLTAKSIVDTVSHQITLKDDDFIPDYTNDTITFPNIQITNDPCSKRTATITRVKDNIIVIVASATSYGQEETIQLTMSYQDGSWKNIGYSKEGETIYEIQQ